MPENISQDQMALDWMTRANPSDQRYGAVQQKLGVDDVDVKAYKWATENPSDPKATQVRNKIFDKIANATPGIDVQGVNVNERMVIKNLIDREPEVQLEYLKRKGYETRVIDNEIEVKKPGEINFKKIDPSGFDKWDATDILSDIGEAVVSTIAGSATGVTGPGAIVAAPAAAGAAGAAYEAGKQAIANVAGVREGFAASPIAESGVMNAAGEFGGRLVSSAFKAISGGLAKVGGLFGIEKKPAAEAIAAASKEIGATPTAGMLLSSDMVQKAEDRITREAGTLGGMGLRKTVAANKKAAFDAAKEIVAEASAKTQLEVGFDVADQIAEDFAKRIQPAANIYEKYETAFKFAKPKKDDIAATFAAVRAKYPMNEGAQAAMNKFEALALGGEKGPLTLEALKELRSEVGAAMREATNGRTKQAIGDLYGALSDLRNTTFLKYAKGKGQAFYEAAAREIPLADTMYRDAMNDAKVLIGGDVGDKMKGFAKTEIAEFMRDTNKAKLVNDLLQTKNPEKVEFFALKYPNVFKHLKAGAIADIADRASVKGEVDPAKLVRILKAIPKESRAMIFGDGAEKKFQALNTYLNALPQVSNPSGTAAAMANSKMWNLWNQGRALFQSLAYDMTSNPALGKDLFSKVANIVGDKKTGAAIKFGLSQVPESRSVFLPQSEPSFDQPVFMPQRIQP